MDCFTLITDVKDRELGFVAAGQSSMIALYKDISDIHSQTIKEAQEVSIQQQQELDNLVRVGEYSRALKLAIKLNKSLNAMNILMKIQKTQTTSAEKLSAIEMSTGTVLGRAVASLETEDLKKLFMFAVKWISNTVTVLIGQQVIGVIMSSVPNSELLSWSEFARHLTILQGHSSTLGFY